MHKVAHIPERSCIVCRKKFPKHSLLRFVCDGNTVMLDDAHRLSGRGAYICSSAACHDRVRVERALRRLFTVRVIPDSITSKL